MNAKDAKAIIEGRPDFAGYRVKKSIARDGGGDGIGPVEAGAKRLGPQRLGERPVGRPDIAVGRMARAFRPLGPVGMIARLRRRANAEGAAERRNG